MLSTKPLVRASVILSFDTFLEQRGVDAKSLYANVGLPPPSEIDPEQDLPANAVCCLMHEAARAAKDPCIGLAFAESYPVGGIGIIAYLFLNSKTVGDGMRTVAHYAVLLRQPMTVQYHDDEDGACLWWRWPEALTAQYTQYGSFAMALFVLRLRMAIGQTWMPVSVELQGEPLACRDKVRQIFGSKVQFGSDKNAIRVDKMTVSRPMPDADPRLKPILDQFGERMMAEISPLGDVTTNVRNTILDLLPERRASLEDVATRLGLTGRTLQARLAAQGATSFEAVLNDVLKARAEDLLRGAELSLTEIAMHLGFSQLSSFTRACRRWFKCSPSAKRQELRSETIP